MALLTPLYDLQDYPDVYEPSEDTHLFLDALEKEMNHLVNLKPLFACEIGCGSGLLITALGSILGRSCAYFCTDVNNRACMAAKKTSTMNSVLLESNVMNLTRGFRCKFDIILFNPPYVVTETQEIVGTGLNRAYAGGLDGREITNNFLKSLPDVLSETGICYLLLLKENKLQEIEDWLGTIGFKMEVVISRKIPAEHLFVFKLFRLT